MKYLRKFNESVEEIDEVVSVLNEMSFEIRDKDLYVEVYPYPRYQATTNHFAGRFGDLSKVKVCLDIRKDEEADNTFYLSDITGEISDILSFMESEGWLISQSEAINRYGGNSVTINLPLRLKILDFSEDEIFYPVYNLYIEFKKR